MLRFDGPQALSASEGAGATMPELDHVAIFLDAESESPIRRQDIVTLTNAVEQVLREIEMSVTGEAPQATWVWGEDEYHLPLMASANGVTLPTLSTVAAAFRDGFAQAATGEVIDWPSDLSEQGRTAAQRILRTLDHLDTLIITTGPDPVGPPVRIESAQVSERVGRRRLRRTRSTVEGHVASLSDRGSYIRGRVVERGTGVNVTCQFPLEMAEQVALMFRSNALLTGDVAYDEEGNPRSMAPVTAIDTRNRGTPLVDFVGSAPNILGGRNLDGFLRDLRADAE